MSGGYESLTSRLRTFVEDRRIPGLVAMTLYDENDGITVFWQGEPPEEVTAFTQGLDVAVSFSLTEFSHEDILNAEEHLAREVPALSGRIRSIAPREDWRGVVVGAPTDHVDAVRHYFAEEYDGDVPVTVVVDNLCVTTL